MSAMANLGERARSRGCEPAPAERKVQIRLGYDLM
jgi:hypothetical protein